MFKTAVSLEKTGKAQIVVLDKTGTVTVGEPMVTDIIPSDGISEDELIKVAYALEKKSEHPLAKAVIEYAANNKISEGIVGEELEVTDFKAVAGNGLDGIFDGKKAAAGNYEFALKNIDKNNHIVFDKMSRKAEELSENGKTPMFFVLDGKLMGIIAVADVIKEDSPAAVRELQNMGIRVVMLTGDNERTAKAIGTQAGVDEVIAGVLPDGKEKAVRRLQEKGSVIMVGDGINDAPALTRADIGIAIGAGTDIAIDSADIVLMKNSLMDVAASIRLSRKTLKNIHENLFWAFIYNVIGIPLAAGVWIPLFGLELNPMYAAAAMSLSSFCVITNALRLNLFDIHSNAHDKKILKINNEKEIKEMTKTIKINGMMCGHCEATVKKALEELDGVKEAAVSHEQGTAVVTLNSEISDDILKKAVEDKEYEVVEIK
jgi:Cu2+-exporting ATPase